MNAKPDPPFIGHTLLRRSQGDTLLQKPDGCSQRILVVRIAP